jgi:RimJ/RimL family protein N-acetyltransferase
VSLALVEDQDHPRVRRAQRYRDDVRVWTCAGGVVTIGRGLAGRWELGFEVDPAARGRGLGRALAISARHLVNELAAAANGDDRPEPAHRAAPGDAAALAPVRPLWAQVAVGNAASLRAVLAAGYRPVGQEAMLVPERAG